MADPALVVMAAGIGSRYGGLKQVDPVGPNGETILDYSVYDALRSGFDTVVFIIRRDFEEDFRDKVDRTLSSRCRVEYVFQDMEEVPEGAEIPENRTKPWGTGHAVLCCRGRVVTPFAVINADDYYGPTAFRALAQHLRNARDSEEAHDYCLVGYALSNTLSEHGDVARGICEVDEEGYLVNIQERTRIRRRPDGIAYTEDNKNWTSLPDDTIVSLNTWGFTPSIFAELQSRFKEFLKANSADLETAEYFLPSIVGELIAERKARIRVLPTSESWFGVTYREDRPIVQGAIRDLVGRGVYPKELWS